MELKETYLVKPACAKAIEVDVPGSKSITNRALLIAALANGKSILRGVLFSDDSRHFLQALMDLGFDVEVDETNATVSIVGEGGTIPAAKRSNKSGQQEHNGSGMNEGQVDAIIDVGSAGTAARFLTAFLGLAGGRYEIRSSEQMKKRPMRELLLALKALGADVTFLEEEDHFPYIIENTGIRQYEAEVDVNKSSQFLSALLIVSVLFPQDFAIHITGEHGMSYVEMTIAMMRQFGVEVQRCSADTFCVSSDRSYSAREYRIEPDVSAASYFYAMCPVLKIPAKVRHVHWNSLQGDTEFLHVLEQMGCTACEDPDGILLMPPEDGLRGGRFDLSAFSDQALTLAAIACFASDEVIITGISHIRYQECDRIHAIIANLTEMGIRCEMMDEATLRIEPGIPKPCEIKTYEDHRVAMAFSIPGLVTDGIVIQNPGCCRKTFEDYFQILEKAVCGKTQA